MLQTSLLIMTNHNKTETPIFYLLYVDSKGKCLDFYSNIHDLLVIFFCSDFRFVGEHSSVLLLLFLMIH